eukprot:12398768-Karenia_brevis.AAC.1
MEQFFPGTWKMLGSYEGAAKKFAIVFNGDAGLGGRRRNKALDFCKTDRKWDAVECQGANGGSVRIFA